MRVLRRGDNLSVVGAYVLYPVTNESDANFFRPPSTTFYLSSGQADDPFQMALPGDNTCLSVYVRVWTIDPTVLRVSTLCQVLEDMQLTLQRMQSDYPEMCDLYALIVHPRHQEIQRALDFELIYQETQHPFAWMYVAIDRFLQLSIPRALAKFNIEETSEFNIL